MEYIVDLLLIFYVYSFVGWCIEVTLKYFEFHRFINRGFLTGPWLPIYGSGGVLITVAIRLLTPLETGFGTTFAVSFILCGALEYISSWALERRYHARWWDYSQKPMNLNGRVWIGNLILFGLAGVAVIHLGNPLLGRLFAQDSLTAREICAGGLSVLFITDFVISRFVMKLVRTGIESSTADNTEEIGREVRLLLSDRSIFYRRFAEAYPDVIYRTERVMKRMEEIRRETERLRAEAEQRVDAVSRRMEESREQIAADISDAREQLSTAIGAGRTQLSTAIGAGRTQIAAGIDAGRELLSAGIYQGRSQLAARIDPRSARRAELIRDQAALIDMLYDETAATDEARALKRRIDEICD